MFEEKRLRISVALAAYNGEKYLTEQLDSIRKQSRVPDEVVVTDDGSPDGTWDVLEKYRKAYPSFPLVPVRNDQNLGYRRNFRKAISLCSGDFLFLCDQDDIWKPEKVEQMARILEERPEVLSVASSFSLIDGDGKPLQRRKRAGWSNQNLYHREVREGDLVQVSLASLSLHNFCQGCALAFRKEIREAFLHFFTEDLPHDWLLNMISASADGLFFYNVPLFSYRLHGDNALGLAVRADRQEKMQKDYRTVEAAQAETFLQTCKTIFPEVWKKNPELERRLSFIERYLHDMREKKAGDLLHLMRDPLYGELKSARGRLGDLAYVCKKMRK